MKGEWIRKPASDAAIVFVHGILSNGETCWSHPEGTYWPELLKNETELSSLGIYVYTYETGFSSGSYSLSDVVDDLKERLFTVDHVADSKKIIFICHSMGGIVVRKLLVERVNDFLDRNVEIGLYLVASPSLGADYANWLEPIAKCAGHAQAKALRFSQDNQWLNDLDRTFQNLKESGRLKIHGKELLEDKFVVLKNLWRKQVVERFTGARYFGESYKVPGSDHFSIAKPQNNEAIQHRLLLEFIKNLGWAPSSNLGPSGTGTSDKNTKTIAQTSRKSMKIFVSYAHNDEAFKDELLIMLRGMERDGVIAIWHDRMIEAGANWRDEIKNAVENCGMGLLLISPDFIASEFIHYHELKQLLQRRQHQGLRVVPIIVRPCLWQEYLGLGEIQALPQNGKPVIKFSKDNGDRDEVWETIARYIRKLVQTEYAVPVIERKVENRQQEKTGPYPPSSGSSGTSVNISSAQPDTQFIRKVREEVKRILDVGRPATVALREVMLKGQAPKTLAEELLITSNSPIDPENAIRLWRKIVKDCLEKRQELVPEIKRYANEVLGWLVLLVVQEKEIAKHSENAFDFSNLSEIIVPVETPAGTGIFVSRLFERAARLQLKDNKVHCTGWIDPGHLETGILSSDRLLEIEREIYRQVFFELPQDKDNDRWLAELRNTLQLRLEDDMEIYYCTLPRSEYSDNLQVIKQLRKDLPHLKAIIIGTDRNGGDSLIVMDEARLVPLLREFLLMLEKYT